MNVLPVQCAHRRTDWTKGTVRRGEQGDERAAFHGDPCVSLFLFMVFFLSWGQRSLGDRNDPVRRALLAFDIARHIPADCRVIHCLESRVVPDLPLKRTLATVASGSRERHRN